MDENEAPGQQLTWFDHLVRGVCAVAGPEVLLAAGYGQPVVFP